MKRIIKIIAIFIPIIILVILYHTGFFFEKLRQTIENKTGAEIKKIDGNLFTNINLTDVKFGKVFYSPKVKVYYSILALIKRKIKNIVVEEPFVIISNSDSSLAKNIIISPFSIAHFYINKGKIIYEKTKIENLELLGKLEPKGRVQKIEIIKGKFSIENEIIKKEIKSLTGKIFTDTNKIEIKEAKLNTDKSMFTIKGIREPSFTKLTINSEKIDIYEFRENVKGEGKLFVTIIQKDNLTKFEGKTTLNKVQYKGNFLGYIDANFCLINDKLDFKINKWVLDKNEAEVRGYVFLSKLYPYEAVFTVKNLDLKKINNKISSNLNGKIKIKGVGSNFNSVFSLSGDIENVKLTSIEGKAFISPQITKIDYIKISKEGEELIVKGEISKERLAISLFGNNTNLQILRKDLQGKANFEFYITGTSRNPMISGSFYVKDFVYRNFRSEYFSGNLNAFTIAKLTGEAVLEFANLNIWKEKFEIGEVTIITSNGKLNYKLFASGENKEFILKGRGDGAQFVIDTLLFNRDEVTISNLSEIKFDLKEGELKLHPAKIVINDSLLQISGEIKKDKIGLYLTGKNIDLHAFHDSLYGNVDFNCNIQGSVRSPIINGAVELTSLYYKEFEVNKGFVTFLYENKVLKISKGNFVTQVGIANVEGEIPISKDKDLPINIKLVLEEFSSECVYLLTGNKIDNGKITGNLMIKGTIEKPLFYGELILMGENVRVPIAKFSSFIAKINFSGEEIKVIAEGEGEKSFLSAEGIAKIRKEMDFRITTKKIEINPLPRIKAFISSNVNLSGNIKRPTLNGTVNVDEAIVSEIPQRKINVDIPFDYDLDINFPEKIKIKTEVGETQMIELDVEIGGEVKVRKERNTIFIAGEAKVNKGYAYYLDVPFKIEEGIFKFTNAPEINPEIDILAKSILNYTIMKGDSIEDDTCEVNLKVVGTLLKPQVELFSDPPMPLEDIISLLTLNIRISELDKIGTPIYSPLTTKAVQLMLRRSGFTEEAKKQLGVDALDFEPEFMGKERRAKFNIGKYILEDLYISYTNDIFSLSKHEFKTEYKPWKYGSIVGEVDKDGKINLGVQLKFRY